MSAVEAVSFESLVTVEEFAERLSVSVRTLWRMRRTGELPVPVRLGKRGTRWKNSDVENYIRGLPSTELGSTAVCADE